MLNLKVGMMPGKLVGVTVEEGTKVSEIFSMANVEISNHDVRLDGEKVSLDSEVRSGALLVATKQIKGNAGTIKVGMMPGKLVEVTYEGGETVGELFNMAGVSVDNHDIRLDGERISIDSTINSGALLVATKQIKGNCECSCDTCTCEKTEKYIAPELTEKEVEMILGISLPTELPSDSVTCVGENFIEINLGTDKNYIVEEDMFTSVYELVEVKDFTDITEDLTEWVETTEQGFPKTYEENIEILVNELEEQRNRYQTWVDQTQAQIAVLKELEFRVTAK